MPAEQLRKFLDSHQVKYVSIRHSPAFTAQEVAASAHIPGKELAKTVIVKIDGLSAMCVSPASEQVDLDEVRRLTGAESVALAHEHDFLQLFPDCETGAMPPFGNLYGMKVYVSKSLTEDAEIAFNAGSHTELFRLAYADFERLVEPTVVGAGV